MSSDVEAFVRDGLAEARSAWPGVHVADDDFARHVAAKIAALPEPASFRALRLTDLYLALACLRHDAKALASFEAQFTPMLERTLGRMKLQPQTAADVRAEIREMLFFGKDGRAPLARDYSGRGELGGWLRAIAVRLAFKVKKTAGRHIDADDALGTLASDANPELAYLRHAHAEAFEKALAAALKGLSARERNLLRQHYIDGLNLDALGRLYRVHRATAARWLAEARREVLDSVRNSLAESMTPSELQSFLRATRRELGLRISTILKVSKKT